jgi:hypothetical protein
MSYDVIGDIHGNAGKLASLLTKMGYVRERGCWRCPGRTAIFLGDFIDRGEQQLATLNIVRPMIEERVARAVMGNHEFNAIAWATEHSRGGYCRTRDGEKGKQNRHQHDRFLQEIDGDSPAHDEVIEWFLKLPLWLDLDGIRVVHACWDDAAISWLDTHLRDRCLTNVQVEGATQGNHNVIGREPDAAATLEFRHIETILKGVEVQLPAGSEGFLDADGIRRHSVRIKWWDERWSTYPQAALLAPESLKTLVDCPLPPDVELGYGGDKPLFIGHYWMTGNPSLLSPKVACVDYSAGRKGQPLVAYRWDGEEILNPANFVTSD